MTEQERKQQLAALVRERDQYRARGDLVSAVAVDQELRRLGDTAETPVKRAIKRVMALGTCR